MTVGLLHIICVSKEASVLSVNTKLPELVCLCLNHISLD